MSMWLPFAFALLMITVCDAHQPAKLFDVFQVFIDSLLPSPSVVTSNSSVLSVDCIGRITGAMTLTGLEDNNELLYDLPHLLRQTNNVSLIGYPVDATIASLSIQLSVVAASVVFSLHYATLDIAIPLQVDMWIVFSDDLRISAYDMNARRFDQALSYVQPKLVPLIVQEMNLTDINQANVTDIVARKAAADICRVSDEHCSGENRQYDSYDLCYEALSRVTFDSNIQMCRYLEKELVIMRPDIHCPSLGLTGGTNCASQDYINTTLSYPFKSSLVAANVSATGVSELSEATRLELFKLNMRQNYTTTVGFYAAPTLLYIFLLYVSGKAVEKLFLRYSRIFVTLSARNQRNTVTYVLNTFYTTVVFILQIICSPMLAEKYTATHASELLVGATIITGLYLYELIFRHDMRISLLAHHLFTIFATVTFITVRIQISPNPAVLPAALIWIFQATTEQSIFIALLLYRLKYSKELVRPLLKFAAIQSFLFKMVFAIYLLVWWGLKLAKFHAPIDIALSVVVVSITVSLMVTQVYGSWSVWSIAMNMDRRRVPQPSSRPAGKELHKDNNVGQSRTGMDTMDLSSTGTAVT